MTIKKLLIANRGEVAVRIARSAADLGISSVAVYAKDEQQALHWRRADEAVALDGHGVRAYLDHKALLDAARSSGCDAVHPGWGFVSEDATFAAACEAAGLAFVGPTPEQLQRVGNKLSARTLAQTTGVPTLPASGALQSATDLRNFRTETGSAHVILKAAAGGGGRGMRVLPPDNDGESAIAQCAAEALAAFGDGTLYAERFLPRARHVEVQILGDGRGAVTHLWERDCTLQRRHQKLIEVAPAPALDPDRRQQLLDAATAMARALSYRGLATFEFLLDVDSDAFYFIETNPRLQVEHTVTEAVTGLDLVALQLGVIGGATLDELGLDDAVPAPNGFAVQVRINAESLDDDANPKPAGGTISRLEFASGPGVRIDTAAYTGQVVSAAYDSLLAKLIVASPGATFERALARTARAASECTIEGTDTNLGLLRALLTHPDVTTANWTTGLVAAEANTLMATAKQLAPAAIPQLPVAAGAQGQSSPVRAVPPGTLAIPAPMRGSVVELNVKPGAEVARGQIVATLEAMKMHHLIASPASGTVAHVLAEVGDTLDEGEPLLALHEREADGAADHAEVTLDLDAPRADLTEVHERHAYGSDQNRPAAVEKRRRIGSRTARENVADLLDEDSFIEYGALAIAAQRRRRSIDDLMQNTPADGMVAGFGTVNANEFGAEQTRCAVAAYDYTVLAGTQGHMNHKKKDRLFELAEEWELPFVFYTEGGGGRPGDVDGDDLIMAWLDLMTFTTWPQMSGAAPRIAINSGRCFAGNAVLFGCADITIATANSNIGLAGPAMIEGGGLGQFRPEDIGPIDVQTANGVVDIAVEDEAEATDVTRRLLGCFQGRLSDWDCADQRELRHLVPENRLRVYDVRKIVHALADSGSVIELRPDYGVGLITAFVRIEGYAFGLIANDSRHLGGAIDGEGGEKGGRFLQLCDIYGIPVISLCDTPGFMVGPDSEKTAAVRRGSRLIVASANLSVPLFTVVLRKGYGLGAQAMAGGSFHQPFYVIAWPTAEFGPMGLEGAVELGFKKELEAAPDPEARKVLYDDLLGQMYTKGKGISVAQAFEIDAVIDPAQTRHWLVRGVRAAGKRSSRRRRYVDVW
ncbi:MAG: carboxyl transferase domain-containing protein [Pseudomonadota bacterium]